MTKLADTEFARKLARAPRTSIAAQVAECDRLLAAQRTSFNAQLVAMVDDIAAATKGRSDSDRVLVRNIASDIAGAGGLMGLAEVAHVASQLAQLGDEMGDADWNWDAIGVFTQTLFLLTKSDDSLTSTDRAMLVDRLTQVRATMKTRASRPQVSA